MPATITVIGLGSGDENQLSLGIWKRLQSASGIVYLRTEDHPVVDFMRATGIRTESFDKVYEQNGSFAEVYEAIADKLLELARNGTGEILYAVPGHPLVAERTTGLLLQRGPAVGVRVEALGGESFLDQAFLRFGFDPIEGFQLLDAAGLSIGMLRPQLHTVIAQVYDVYTASEVKLSLMDMYPDDYPVVVGHELGVAGRERIDRIPLFELDRLDGYGNLSLVWVPRSDRDELRGRSFERLHEIVRILRSPEGCPWDREQTHASIRKNLIEETYEVLETIDDDDPEAMGEELGDLLLQVMLHSQIEEETGAFTVYDVIAGLNEKLIRRHPHVFGDRVAGNAEEALANWQDIKREEKAVKGIDTSRASALDGVPRDLPALLKAWKLQKKAAAVGFDWDRAEEVLAKIVEELDELKAEMSAGDRVSGSPSGTTAGQQEELGDLLFSVVNLARFLSIDPEEALALTNKKFKDRFAYVENRLIKNGGSVEEASLEEMEAYWNEAKRLRKN